MSDVGDDIDEIDLENTDSKLYFEFDATRDEYFEKSLTGSGQTHFRTEGTLVEEYHLGNSLTDIDYYFDPDCTYNWPNVIEEGNVKLSFYNVHVRWDVYPDELRAAARKATTQKGNDNAAQVLAGWLHQSRRDHVDKHAPRTIYTALKREVESRGFDDPNSESEQWAVTYTGRVNERENQLKPNITTLDEAREYADGGYSAVRESRDDE